MDRLWRFGAFELDARSRELAGSDRKLKLQEQPFQILTALIERRGEVVTREELRKRVWSGDTFVDFDNGLNVAIAKLRHALDDHAEKPAYIETLPRIGYRFVAAVVELPAHVGSQPASAAEPPATPASAQPARHWFWAIIPALLVIALFLFLIFAKRAANPPAVALRPSVAIMGFRNLAGTADRNWLSTALAEMLATDLATGDRLRIVPGESVARTKIELALPDAESYSAQTLAKMRRSLGADYVLVGSYLNTGPQQRGVRLDLRLQDSKTGETLAIAPASGGEDDLAALAAQAAQAVRQRLSVTTAAPAENASSHGGPPPSTDSARLYAEGLDRLRHFDASGARDLLGQAVAADPGYAPAHAALSDAWSDLGYAEVARSEAQKAWQLSPLLPPIDRLSIEARYRVSNSEWDQAVRIYTRLIEQFPDDAGYGLNLARVQINAGKANDAQATLDRLRRLPFPLADEATVSIVKSQASEKLGDFESAQAAASEAASIAHKAEAQLLEAGARAMECRQLVQLSRLDRAVAACQSARRIYERLGHRPGLAESMAYLAAAYCNQGNIAEARTLYTQALDIDRETGNARDDAQWALNGLAVLLLSQGDLSGSRQLYEESLGMARRVGSRPGEVSELSNIAATWMMEGDLRRARDLFEQALKGSRSISDKATAANILNNLGHTLYLLGNLTEAGNTLSQALEADRDTGAKLERADALSWLVRVRIAQAKFDEAQRLFDECKQVSGEINGPLFAAQYRLPGAELSLATGHPADAESVVRGGLESFQKAKAPDIELEARTLLTRILLAENKFDEARQEMARADSLARATHRRAAWLAFSIVSARASAAGNPPQVAQALRSLQTTAADAARQGFVGYQLDARLAAASLDPSRAALIKLAKDARAGGFEALAREASAELEHLKN